MQLQLAIEESEQSSGLGGGKQVSNIKEEWPLQSLRKPGKWKLRSEVFKCAGYTVTFKLDFTDTFQGTVLTAVLCVGDSYSHFEEWVCSLTQANEI